MLPDLKRLGPKLGKQLPRVKRRWPRPTRQAAGTAWKPRSRSPRTAGGPVTLDAQDLQIRLQAKRAGPPPGPCLRGGAVDRFDDELVAEGIAREVVHAIQTAARNTAVIYRSHRHGLVTDDAECRPRRRFAEYIQAETLAEPRRVRATAQRRSNRVRQVSVSTASRLHPSGGPDVTVNPPVHENLARLRAAVLHFGRRHDAGQLLEKIRLESCRSRSRWSFPAIQGSSVCNSPATPVFPLRGPYARSCFDQAKPTAGPCSRCRAGGSSGRDGRFLEARVDPARFRKPSGQHSPRVDPRVLRARFYGHHVHEAVLERRRQS